VGDSPPPDKKKNTFNQKGQIPSLWNSHRPKLYDRKLILNDHLHPKSLSKILTLCQKELITLFEKEEFMGLSANVRLPKES
jgi:hypothetical protein